MPVELLVNLTKSSTHTMTHISYLVLAEAIIFGTLYNTIIQKRRILFKLDPSFHSLLRFFSFTVLLLCMNVLLPWSMYAARALYEPTAPFHILILSYAKEDVRL